MEFRKFLCALIIQAFSYNTSRNMLQLSKQVIADVIEVLSIMQDVCQTAVADLEKLKLNPASTEYKVVHGFIIFLNLFKEICSLVISRH